MNRRVPPPTAAGRIPRPRHRGGRRRLSRLTAAVVAIVAIVGLGGAVSYAYFTSTGSATGSAGDGTLQSVSVTAGAPSSPLLPGGSSDVVFSVTNPNGSPVNLVTVALNGAVVPDSSHSGCTTTDGHAVVAVTIPSGELPVSIPAHTTKTIDLTNAATMDVAATSNCQGATFSIPLTVTVQP